LEISPSLFFTLPRLVPGQGESREYRQEQRFASEWASTASGYSIKNAWPIFTQLRLVKSPMELRIMQHAIDISIEAHQRAWAAAADTETIFQNSLRATKRHKRDHKTTTLASFVPFCGLIPSTGARPFRRLSDSDHRVPANGFLSRSELRSERFASAVALIPHENVVVKSGNHRG